MAAVLRARIVHIVAALVALFALGATAASAETLMMPNRDAKKGVSVVVWGISTLPNGTAFTLDYGDGGQTVGSVGDRSYVAFNHTYNAAGKFTATLTVGGESATTVVQVFDTAQLTAENLRSLGINMAIQDGLRWLWVTQQNRTTFDTNALTLWNGGNGFAPAYTSFVTLAFENHGFKVQDKDGNPATDIYGKYAVRRGLNYVIANLATLTIGTSSKQRFDPDTYALTNYVDDPCVGLVGATDPCVALYNPSDQSYQTAVSMLALAGSGAMNRVNTEVGGYTNGKTYKEILQRLANAEVYGQNDGGNGRGGWCYNFNQGCGDGSTLGWAVLSLLDAEASGVVVPPFVKEELKYQVGWQKADKTVVLNGFARNNDGGLDYCADGNPSGNCSAGIEKGGIPLQAYLLTGQSAKYFLGHDPADEAEVRTGLAGTFANNTINYLNNQWNSVSQTWGCNTAGDYLRGCSYAMFNAFKGLKLTGITTMSNSNRAAGPGTIQAHDWYAEFQDYLVSHQQSPNSTGGGWFPASWSCCESSAPAIQAIAELVLSPVALVLPDEAKFSTVGLTHVVAGVDSIDADSAIEGGTHTVTAKAVSSNGTPVAGSTVVFTVVSGPNAGASGSGVTNSSGKVSFTYSDPLRPNNGSVGQDVVQASIGSMNSNQVVRNWLPRTPTTTAVVCPVSVVYNGAPQTVCTATTFVTADPTTVLVANALVTYTDNVNPGSATASASYAGTAEYGPSTGSTNFDILKADAVITVNGYTGVYDGQPHGATGSATGIGELDLTNLLNLGDSFTAVPGGTATWMFAGNEFYNAASGPVAITITPRPATVTIDPKTKVYGTSDPALTGTLNGFLVADNVTATYSRVAGQDAGSYPISATLSPAGSLSNYAVTRTAANLTITKAVLTVQPHPSTGSGSVVTRIYGTSTPNIVVGITGFVNGDFGNVVSGSANLQISDGLAPHDATRPVGSYGITVTQGTLTAANYTFAFLTGTLNVVKRPASVTPNAASKEYGAADPVLSGTLSGFLAGDNVTAAYSRTAGDTVGSYTISAALAPAGVLSNYDITSNTAIFTITKKAASVTPNAATKVFGDADPVFSGTLTGFLAADNVTASYSRAAGELVAGSPYTISATLAPVPVLDNYEIAYNTAALTITKRATTTTLATSLAVSAAGNAVTFTATVATQQTPASTTGTVTFRDGAVVIGTVAINGATASFTTSSLANGPHAISASYSGDSNYIESASNTVDELIYAYPGAGNGTFVIGDLNAAVNTRVTFWGAQWERLNALTGGKSNASFKGYANLVAGGAWATDPGNSSNPPAPVLPNYIGIIVTNKVNKSGAAISGAIVQVVVVRTDAGYDANPGHAGTGTVVAIVP